MELSGYLLDILKFTLAGIGTVYAAFYLIKPYLDKAESLQLMELKKALIPDVLCWQQRMERLCTKKHSENMITTSLIQ